MFHIIGSLTLIGIHRKREDTIRIEKRFKFMHAKKTSTITDFNTVCETENHM